MKMRNILKKWCRFSLKNIFLLIFILFQNFARGEELPPLSLLGDYSGSRLVFSGQPWSDNADLIYLRNIFSTISESKDDLIVFYLDEKLTKPSSLSLGPTGVFDGETPVCFCPGSKDPNAQKVSCQIVQSKTLMCNERFPLFLVGSPFDSSFPILQISSRVGDIARIKFKNKTFFLSLKQKWIERFRLSKNAYTKDLKLKASELSNNSSYTDFKNGMIKCLSNFKIGCIEEFIFDKKEFFQLAGYFPCDDLNELSTSSRSKDYDFKEFQQCLIKKNSIAKRFLLECLKQDKFPYFLVEDEKSVNVYLKSNYFCTFKKINEKWYFSVLGSNLE